MIASINELKLYHKVNGDLTMEAIQPEINSAVSALKAQLSNTMVASIEGGTSVVYPFPTVKDRLKCFVACTALAGFVASNQFSISNTGNRSVNQTDTQAVKLWEINKQVSELRSKAEAALSEAILLMMKNQGSFAGLNQCRCWLNVDGLIFKTAEDFERFQSIGDSYTRFMKMTGRIRAIQAQRLLPMMGNTLLATLTNLDDTANSAVNSLRTLCQAAVAPLAYADALSTNLFRLDDVANRPELANTDATRELSTDKAIALAINSARAIGEQGMQAVKDYIANVEGIPYLSPWPTGSDYTNSDSPVFKF